MSGATSRRPINTGQTNSATDCAHSVVARIAWSPKPEKRQSIGKEPDGEDLPAEGTSASRGLLSSLQVRLKAARQRPFVEAADEVLIERREDYLAKRMVYVRRSQMTVKHVWVNVSV